MSTALSLGFLVLFCFVGFFLNFLAELSIACIKEFCTKIQADDMYIAFYLLTFPGRDLGTSFYFDKYSF